VPTACGTSTRRTRTPPRHDDLIIIKPEIQLPRSRDSHGRPNRTSNSPVGEPVDDQGTKHQGL
jgi:hypothetical protein